MARKKTEVEFLEEEVKRGNGQAYYNLGYIYLLGQGVNSDPKKAIGYFRKGTTHQDPKCMQALAMCYKNGDGVEVDYSMTIYWLNQGVKLNDHGCMYQLGICFENGIGVEKSIEEARRLMEKCAKKNKDARLWLRQHGFSKPTLMDRLFGGQA